MECIADSTSKTLSLFTVASFSEDSPNIDSTSKTIVLVEVFNNGGSLLGTKNVLNIDGNCTLFTILTSSYVTHIPGNKISNNAL